MKRFVPFAFAALVVAAVPAAAESVVMPVEGGMMSYELFETAIDHADLPECPPGIAPEGSDAFCRVTVAGGRAHVFAFSYDGEQPLLAVASYDLGTAEGLPF